MPAIVTGSDGRSYAFRATARETVFVAKMPTRSDARCAPHTGLAILCAWLDPVMAGEPMALVRVGNGALRQVVASAIRPATGLATRRLGPAPIATRRTA